MASPEFPTTNDQLTEDGLHLHFYIGLAAETSRAEQAIETFAESTENGVETPLPTVEDQE